MDKFAAGTKAFSRVDKLCELRKSLESTENSKLYMADDGRFTPEKQEVFRNSRNLEDNSTKPRIA